MKRNRLSAFFDALLNIFAYFSGILIVLMIFFISFACFARYLDFKPPVWILQFTEYALLWITFLGSGWLLRLGGHIRMDTVITRFGDNTRLIVDLIDDLLGLGICLVLFWFGLANTIDLYHRQIMDFNAVILPKYLIFWVIPVGGLLLLLQFLRSIAHHLKQGKNKAQGQTVGAEVR